MRANSIAVALLGYSALTSCGSDKVEAPGVLADANTDTPDANTTLKHYMRHGPNLLQNPSMNDAGCWSPRGNAFHDSGTSRTSGSGSFNISVRLGDGITGIENSACRVPVQPGKLYTFGGYVASNVFPADVLFWVTAYDADGNPVIEETSRGISPRPGRWDEFAYGFEAPASAAFAEVEIVTWTETSHRLDGDIWVDDLYFGEGLGFENPPSPKQAFDGATVRLDELGNFEINRDGAWVAFFPFGLWYDGNHPDVANRINMYSSQGFNMIVNGLYPQPFTHVMFDQLQMAKHAVSAFNPDGLMAFMQIGSPSDTDVTATTEAVNQLLSSPFASHAIAYVFDNEFLEYDVITANLDAVRVTDVTSSGQRHRPIAMLNKDSVFRASLDIVGDYVYWRNADPSHITLDNRSFVQWNIAYQDRPMFANLTCVDTADGVRKGVYAALVHGVRAITYWNDPQLNCGDGTIRYIEDSSAWPELPRLRGELDQLLPLIREPHWTSWELASSQPLIYGTRDHAGAGHVIAVNPSQFPRTVTFTISGLPYDAAEVRDYFTGDLVAPVSSSQFTVTLPACTATNPRDCTAVYRLAGSIP